MVINNTKAKLISSMFSHQKSRKVKRKSVCYSKEEFFEWCLSQSKFHDLWNTYEMSGWKQDLMPSVDRIDPLKPYEFGNMQIMTYRENIDKGNKIDQLKVKGKKVIGIDRNNLPKIFNSLKEASIETGINQGHISDCCYGKRKTAGKISWRFK